MCIPYHTTASSKREPLISSLYVGQSYQIIPCRLPLGKHMKAGLQKVVKSRGLLYTLYLGSELQVYNLKH